MEDVLNISKLLCCITVRIFAQFIYLKYIDISVHFPNVLHNVLLDRELENSTCIPR